MTLTRGVASGGQRDPRVFENRLYAYAIPFVWLVTPEETEAGISLTVSSVQRIPPSSVDPNFLVLEVLRQTATRQRQVATFDLP